MKIGIITYQKVNNFGADLQAYALQAKLRALGYDAENIDYLHYKHPRFKSTPKSKRIVPISLKTRIKAFLIPLVSKLRNLKKYALIKQRETLFDRFEQDFLVLTREFQTIDALYEKCPQYDVYISGSDQIWNPRSDTSLAPYFLDFAPQGAKCISYASSFGVSELPDATFIRFKQLLKRFSSVGVREKSGLRLVDAMTLGVETKQVLDPTLLLTADEWSKVAKAPRGLLKEPFVLLYDLIASPEAVALAHHWAKELKCTVIRIGDGAYGPSEFIWLFANASAVVTTSFHGTVFSILNHKPFYSVIPSKMTNASRIESLVELLDLKARVIRASQCENVDCALRIDYNLVDANLCHQRKDSLDFLIRAIQEPPKAQPIHQPLATYAVWNKDEAIRANSTSGGLFHILAEETIAQQGVVFGAAFSKDFKSVQHVCASTLEELKPLMKSKYVWSDPSQAYSDALKALKDGRKVLFSGTPCQVAVMTKLAEGFLENLVTVDFVCHGTPKPEVWKAYADTLEARNESTLEAFDFRNKDKGWNSSMVFYSFKNGKYCKQIPWTNSFLYGFAIGAFWRPACYSCAFANPKRPSDFTIGDCWRVATTHPQYDDNKGTSLVLVNTQKAKKLWEEFFSSGKINGGEYDFDLAQIRNSALMNPASKPGCYTAFEKVFNETHNFSLASKTYLSWKKKVKYTLVYFIKKLGWFYFKKHQ